MLKYKDPFTVTKCLRKEREEGEEEHHEYGKKKREKRDEEVKSWGICYEKQKSANHIAFLVCMCE